MPQIECDVCGTSFVPKTNAKRCSKECISAHNRVVAKEWYYKNHDSAKAKRNEYSKLERSNNTLATLFRSRQNDAKNRGIPFTITLEDLPIPDVCPILKTPFTRKTQYAMSIDKIKPDLGYIPGNVQIISRKANLMKNDATQKELEDFGKWIKEYLGAGG
jgi:hypothetical protein